MNQESPIEKALRLPCGGRFRRCALRVRPWDFVREAVAGTGGVGDSDEHAFNSALVEACRRLGVEVIALEVREHGESSASTTRLERAAEDAGISVLRSPEGLGGAGLGDADLGDGQLSQLREVTRPEDLDQPDAWCWVKMSEVSAEALRQAVLDPGSRIRRAGDPEPERRVELVAMTWQSGGFLGEMAIHFNRNLNVLVGGRGAGKSTILESLRYVLGASPLGEEAKKLHQGIVRHVLRSGTKISLLVRSHRPDEREYVIERTVPNPPVVRTRDGEVLELVPSDVLPRAEIYGQHEIAELVRSPDKLTRLLERFTTSDATAARRHEEIGRELERARRDVLDVHRELARIDDSLAALPALEETLRRFQESGLEVKLRERSLLVREEQILKTADDRLTPFRQLLGALKRALPLDQSFLGPSAEALPGQDILAAAEPVLRELDRQAADAVHRLATALEDAERGLAGVRERWNERGSVVQAAYEETLRELQQSQVDGEEFIRLRHQIEQLRPLKERQAALRESLQTHTGQRQRLLTEWEDAKATAFRELERAAERVNVQLDGRVRVRLEYAGYRDPLFKILREQIGGRLSEAVDALRGRESLSLGELVSACRAGREALIERFNIPPAQAERLSQATPETLMEIEELDLQSNTMIELNTGGWSKPGLPAAWQPLDQLSTGQKATAVLLLLLLESDAPLVVDQPEDDLDNRFIADGIVPKMREEKLRRQFIFATHNANIPVIGDAELILGLAASGEAGQGRARVSPELMGSIDERAIQALVEEVLEGGRAAFETRRRKYGF